MKKLHVIMQGGLGNQLFTYFAAADYASTYNRDLVLHTDELSFGFTERDFQLDKFNLPYPYKIINNNKSKSKLLYIIFQVSRKFLFKFMKRLAHFSTTSGYDQLLLSKPKLKIVKGYFQTYQYYDNIIRKYPDLKIDLKYKSNNFIVVSKLIQETQPVMIHIRRGDYKKLREIYGLLTEDYYVSALKKARLKSQGNLWLVSDDAEEIRSGFKKIRFDFYLSDIHELKDFEILSLMSLSNNLILSNSSFSWWGGKLGNSSKNVIFPCPWYPNSSNAELSFPADWQPLPSIWENA